MMLVTPLFQKIYADNKLLTLTPHSFPARHLSDIMANEVDLEKPFFVFTPSLEMLMYNNPTTYAELTNTIANHGRGMLVDVVGGANAIWLCQDGSVDLSNVDNEFHSLRIVTREGKLEHKFLSLEEKLLHGSEGQYDCLQRSLASLYPNSGDISAETIIDLIRKKHIRELDAEDFQIPEEPKSESVQEMLDIMDRPF